MATEIGPTFATADCRLDSLAATETDPVAVAAELVLLYLFEMSFKSHKCFDIISFKLLSSRMFKLKNIF